MNPDEESYVTDMNRKLNEESQRADEASKGLHTQMGLFGSEGQDNLIRWQLDLKEDIDRIYHLLKGDIIKYDDDGNVFYDEPDDPDLMPFNENGVQTIMNVMYFYLNRNTILSNYSEDVIKWKVHDFGWELNDLIFNKYDDMMMTIDIKKEIEDLIGHKVTLLKNGKYVANIEYKDGEIYIEELGESITDYIDEIRKNHISQKIKLFPMIVRELVDSVHSAYLRAYHGGERESLRTARTVTQSEPLYHGGMSSPQVSSPQSKSKWYNPFNR